MKLVLCYVPYPSKPSGTPDMEPPPFENLPLALALGLYRVYAVESAVGLRPPEIAVKLPPLAELPMPS